MNNHKATVRASMCITYIQTDRQTFKGNFRKNPFLSLILDSI